MNAKLSDVAHPDRAEKQLNVVLLFESNRCRAHGIDIATYIQKRFHVQANLACHLWRWEELAGSRCRKAAARQALGADLVIVASDGRRHLLPEMVDWMQAWNDKPRGRRVLVMGTVSVDQQESPQWLNNRRMIVKELGARSSEPMFVTHDGVCTRNAAPSADGAGREEGTADEVLNMIATALAAAPGGKRQGTPTPLPVS